MDMTEYDLCDVFLAPLTSKYGYPVCEKNEDIY